MIVIGLTGSIGMGKSTVAAMFADEGVPVFDADAAVHALQAAGGSAVAAIEAAFPGTTGSHGVDRTALGNAVFGDNAALKQLESILHPAVRTARIAFLADHAEAGVVLLDIPLLFETGGDAEVDVVVVVSAPRAVQDARVLGRARMTPKRYAAILSKQTPDADKRARADFVIDTSGPLSATRAQVRAVLACVATHRGG